MIDAVFTYGGHCLGFVAIGLWIRLACAGPGFQAWIAGRYEDELQFGAPSAPDHPDRMSRIAYGVALLALVCQSIGFAIPD